MSELFTPFHLKDITLRNRIAVSPMCQYSAVDGVPNDWHFVHLGARAIGGAGLVVAEATAVTPEGRISPGCTGIWSDTHTEAFARIVRFVESHGSVPGIQIAHAGRKASAALPWEGGHSLDESQGGWPTVGPSAEAFGAELPKVPKAMTVEEIADLRQSFVAAAKRALDAGFRWLELHFAHGYLAHSFYSPLSNHRTDRYGGSFDNRTRLLTEILEAVREVWPEKYPLTARLSVTDWIEGGATVEDSIELAKRFKAGGLDLLDASQGFVTPDISKVPWGPGFMLPIAGRIRREANIPTTTSWLITDAKQAEEAIRSKQVDIVMLAREMLRDPHWPYHAAKELGEENPQDVLPIQYSAALKR